ncbi:MAG: ferrochelatase [Prevotellaceae bacterium]|nr:ferrochelatase [Prevotellaceae bacterium]
MKKALFLIYTGSPDSHRIWDVMIYLYRFLNDRRIISLPRFFRLLIVSRCIFSLASYVSSKRYKLLAGLYKGVFPLPFYCEFLKNSLAKELDIEVFIGMCFGKPLIEDCVRTIVDRRISKVMLMPMYPHYSSSASGIPLERALKSFCKYPVIPEIVSVNSFYNEKGFINAFIERIKEYDYQSFDEIVFSYHSLPEAHVSKWDNRYPEECAETTKLICNELGIKTATTSFQSQMSKKWLGPATKSVLAEMIKNGKTRALVVAPSFVSDCLETEIEINIELKKFFMDNGGKELQLVKSLNNHPAWIDFIAQKYRELMK